MDKANLVLSEHNLVKYELERDVNLKKLIYFK